MPAAVSGGGGRRPGACSRSPRARAAFTRARAAFTRARATFTRGRVPPSTGTGPEPVRPAPSYAACARATSPPAPSPGVEVPQQFGQAGDDRVGAGTGVRRHVTVGHQHRAHPGALGPVHVVEGPVADEDAGRRV